MDHVRVQIPALPQYLRIIRLTASGLASRLGFTLDEIEDLKIAVDELAGYLTGSQGREGTLEVTFRVSDDRIEIVGIGRLEGSAQTRTKLTEISKMILDTVADSATLAQPDGHPRFELVKAHRS